MNENELDEFNPDNLPEILPMLPLFDAVLFPKMVLPLLVTKGASIQLVEEAVKDNRIIGLVVPRKIDQNGKIESNADMYKVGTIATILKISRAEDERVQILVQGLSRFKIMEFIKGKPYHQVRPLVLKDSDIENDKEVSALVNHVNGQFNRIVGMSPGLPREFGQMAASITEPGTLADMVASTINTTVEEKQKILEHTSIKARLKIIVKLLTYQLDLLELGNKIQTEVKGGMDKHQRDFYLREQIKVIRDELGEGDETAVEVAEYRAKIKKNKLPEHAKKEAERELTRLARMHPSSSEYTVSSTYLDWLTALPWEMATKDRLDIPKARRVLDKDHFGLDKIKKRIVEYLAVRKLNPDSKGPILCFAGPPGTGKTSLGRSIARALGRKFIRISLGGMRDEAEIRGHRRTYLGALPGRIIQGIRRAGSNNPVFMLDEIDKIGMDFRGDPSAALLEVLDPEQNFSFSDHYVDVTFDLSKVMFITTANILDTIPPALQDRLEVLRLHGYTDEEKLIIAKRYLIPRQRKENGLKSNQITIAPNIIQKVINSYTREAGLRNLEREIATICRKVATIIVEGLKKRVFVKDEYLSEYLGTVRFIPESVERTLTPGVSIGLAWTQAGGEILFVEATDMQGSKNLTLTGQLGEIMQESASTALSFVRANARVLKIADRFFENLDIHIHVPEGAIPKDGPSAGVTILTALVSLLTLKKTRKKLAMTGEITLRGQILPVGGIKEKILAAHRAGITTIILPEQNKKDIEDLPRKIRAEVEIKFTDNMLALLELTLEN